MKDVCGYCLDKEATTKRFFDVCDFYGIKNKDLVKLFNVSDVTVSYWRNGSRFPEWDKIMLFAYTVGLPLDVMIIGKKSIEQEEIKRAINKIEKLKEKKYKDRLQELLDSGELDFPPMLNENIFNPLENRTDFSELYSYQYAKLLADVRYYGLEKKVENKEDFSICSKAFGENSDNSNLLGENNEENSNCFSISIYINYNNCKKQSYDENGNLLNGYIIDAEAYENEKRIIILRFRNGFLDGDEYDKNGKCIRTRPAVETVGHIEYWRQGKLHRDNKEPAVISKGFSSFEYWENGSKIG